MTFIRRRLRLFAAIVLAVPGLAALVAVAEAVHPVESAGIKLETILSVAGTGLACYAMSQRAAEKSAETARSERAAAISGAIHAHDRQDDAHAAATLEAHRELERADSATLLRVHDVEKFATSIGKTLEKLVTGQTALDTHQTKMTAQLERLLDEHTAARRAAACAARNTPVGETRVTDPPDFDPGPLRTAKSGQIEMPHTDPEFGGMAG